MAKVIRLPKSKKRRFEMTKTRKLTKRLIKLLDDSPEESPKRPINDLYNRWVNNVNK